MISAAILFNRLLPPAFSPGTVSRDFRLNIGNRISARYGFLYPSSNIGELVVRFGIIVRYRFSIRVAGGNFGIYWYGVD